MSNTFITPTQVARQVLPNLYANSVFLPLVWRNYSNEFQSIGNTVTVKTPTTFTAIDFDGDVSDDYQNTTETSQLITMDKFKTVDASVTSTEMTLEVSDFNTEFSIPAAEALAQAIDISIATELGIASYLNRGTPGTAPSSLEDIVTVREKLNINNAPNSDRSLVVDSAGAAKLLQLDTLVEVDKSGMTQALREGTIGRVYGLTLIESNNVYDHTIGDMVVGTSPTVTGAADAVSIVVASGGVSKTLLEGDIITIASVDYVVTADMAVDSSGDGTILIAPGLVAAASGTSLSAIKAAGTLNVGFQKNAMAFVSRPLSPTLGGADSAVLNFQGISIRVVYDYNSSTKTNLMSFDVLYGLKALRRQNIVRLYG